MKEIKQIVKDIERSVHDKLALMKMILLKLGDQSGGLKKLRGYLSKGDANNADKILTGLE
eukprot:CAMPEP_0202959628 /NCGR_PEP_ID=MMETSP1396-20130829/3811_1 /ASSEMBLY_ACC=CAM_ASM_000872 /TAXON_ID= /ORGANISM="Pseudokeronopsis sp., Strain Brazil" /LENGTH=59 /DNA_ID=CAMNT_0049678297 /DNA_START=435 /DNA_END=614 /DNA_ORIENTATION=+